MTSMRPHLVFESVPLLRGWGRICFDADIFGSDTHLRVFGEGKDDVEAYADYTLKLSGKPYDVTSLPEVSQ